MKINKIKPIFTWLFQEKILNNKNFIINKNILFVTNKEYFLNNKKNILLLLINYNLIGYKIIPYSKIYYLKDINTSIVNNAIKNEYLQWIDKLYNMYYIQTGKKRKNINCDNYINQDISSKEFVSASKLKNYIINDTLCDWLSEFSNKNNNSIDRQEFSNKNLLSSKKNTQNLSELYANGIEFELNIINFIKNKFPKQYVYISNDNISSDSVKQSKFIETLHCIKQGVPIIFQAVLHNYINKTFGVADILIRSDYINKLIPNVFDPDENFIANKISKNYHYRVIEIKSSIITLNNNNPTIRNSSNLIKFYKAQTFLYNKALGLIQAYTPEVSYILAKKYKQNKKTYNWNEILAVVEYNNYDKQIEELFCKAVQWVKYLRTYGKDWDPKDPHISELLPNFKSKYNVMWNDYKKQLLNNKSDILELWNTSIKHRNLAIKNRIYCWRSQQFSVNDIGFNIKNKNSKILDIIIKMNQNNTLFSQYGYNIVYPDNIINNYKNWKQKNSNDFYLDFESITVQNNIYIFMIGLGYYKDKWYYKQFLLEELNLFSEKNLFLDFFNYLPDNCKLFHWGSYENTMINKKIKEHKLEKYIHISYELVDMLKIFKDEPIVIRGALNFNLKNVARAFYNYNLIETIWDKNDLDGLIVSSEARKVYSQVNDYDQIQNKLENITKYNEIDCKVLYEILLYLRNM